jgi:phosphomannomutase / phosphoglucomutase
MKTNQSTTTTTNSANYQTVINIPQTIFRAYDIRGIVGKEFTPNNIYTIGLAIGSEALERGEHTIAIGRDGRTSGPELSASLQAGIIASGCNVIDVGMVTTPVLYFATNTLNTRSGVMLTGSHNPPEYNGLKIVIGGETLYEDAITKLYRRIINRDFKQGKGSTENVSVIDNYVKRVVSDIKLKRKLKVIIDCGNGVGGIVAPQLFRELGCEVIELFCEVDGTFPNHHPDPSDPKNLRDIITAIKQHKADVGLAFDGDADRVGVITNKGEIISADRLLMFCVIDMLKRHPNAVIPFDVKCTRHLAEQIKAHGGQPLMWKTGHSLIKAKMKQLGSPIAGELSGHMFFKERWYGFDDGVYAAARCVELLTQDPRSSSEVFAEIPNSVATPELKAPVAEDKKFPLMKEIVEKVRFGNEATISTVDGLRADFKDGFGLVRASNTSPFLVLRFEGDDEAALQRITAAFKQQLLAIEPTLQLPI